MTAIESAWNRALSWLGRFIKWTPLSATAARLLRHVREPSMPSMVEYWSGYYRLGAEHGIPRIKKTRDHSWAHDCSRHTATYHQHSGPRSRSRCPRVDRPRSARRRRAFERRSFETTPPHPLFSFATSGRWNHCHRKPLPRTVLNDCRLKGRWDQTRHVGLKAARDATDRGEGKPEAFTRRQ